MKLPKHILFLSRELVSVWRTGAESTESGSAAISPAGNATFIIQQLFATLKVKIVKLAIVLDSDLVVAAQLPESAAKYKNLEALTYEAETLFPLVAEEMGVGLAGTRPTDKLIVGCDLALINEIGKSLEGLGIRVTDVFCGSLLICQAMSQVVSKREWKSNKIKRLRIGRRRVNESLVFQNTGVLDWFLGDDDEKPDYEIKEEPGMAKAVAEAWLDLARLSPTLIWGRMRGNFAWQTGTRKDASDANLIGFALMILLLAIASGFFVRSLRQEAVLAKLDSEERELAVKIFPTKKRIRSLLRELESENALLEKKLAGLSSIAKLDSPLTALYLTLKSMPEIPGIAIKEFRFGSNSASIIGSANEIASLTSLVELLKNQGLDVRQDKYAKDFELSINLTSEQLRGTKSKNQFKEPNQGLQ